MTVRPEQRADQRPEPPRLTRHSRSLDRFFIPPEIIPQGTSYEWKRMSVFGKEDTQHQVHLARNHWKPVPAGRHPELSGGVAGDERPIVIDGLILMERPKYLTDEARAEDQFNANRQVAQQLERLDQIEGIGKDFEQTRPSVVRTYERNAVPDDPETP